MKKVKEFFIMFLSIVLMGAGLALADNYGSKDRSYTVKDSITGKLHSVTNRSMEQCKGLPHYSVIQIDGVSRRCVKVNEE